MTTMEMNQRKRPRPAPRHVAPAEVLAAAERADRLAKLVNHSSAREPIRRVTVQLIRLIRDLLPAADVVLAAAPDDRATDVLRATIGHSRSVLIQADAGTMRSAAAQLTLLAGVSRQLLRIQGFPN